MDCVASQYWKVESIPDVFDFLRYMRLRNLVRRPTSQQSVPQAQSSQPRIETLSSSKALPVANKTGSKTAAADDLNSMHVTKNWKESLRMR